MYNYRSYNSKPAPTPTDARRLAIILALIAMTACMIAGICTRGCRSGCGVERGCSRSNVIDTSGFISPGSKNNLDLVAWANIACENRWGYVWGTYGCVLTDSVYEQKLAQYPVSVGSYSEIIEQQWIGRRTVDCIGLIKGYSWYEVQEGYFGYNINGMPDIGANKMYDTAAEKGEIATIPETPGLAVWVDGHIGVYIGGGWVIEAKSTEEGVVKTRLADRPWTHWLKIPYIEYM